MRPHLAGLRHRPRARGRFRPPGSGAKEISKLVRHTARSAIFVPETTSPGPQRPALEAPDSGSASPADRRPGQSSGLSGPTRPGRYQEGRRSDRGGRGGRLADKGTYDRSAIAFNVTGRWTCNVQIPFSAIRPSTRSACVLASREVPNVMESAPTLRQLRPGKRLPNEKR